MLALLQFDAASLPIVLRMIEDERLPTLSSLRRSGRWHTLDADAAVLQSSTYPTLFTGSDVRRHGIYSTYPWSPSDQRVRFVRTLPRPATVWERLSAAGARSLVVDPYISWPPRLMEGVFVSGWQFEDRMALRPDTVPRELRTRLVRRHGAPPRLDDVYGRHSLDSLSRLRDHLVAGPGRTAQVVTDLLRHDRFELIWVNFAVAHKAGHQLWDASTVANGGDEATDGKTTALLQSWLEDVYEAVDRALGRIVAALPDEADVIVFSPTGMAANTSRADMLPEMLARVLGEGLDGSHRGTSGRAPIWRVRQALPVGLRSAVARALPDRLVADVTTRLHARSDWSRTKAFTVPGENKGYVRINLRGRERDGIVCAAEADELMDAIIAGLTTFRDPDGSPAVACVVRMTELAAEEPYHSALPDLVVLWGDAPKAPLTHLVSGEHGTVRRGGSGSGRSGNHVDDAWAILRVGSDVVDPGRPLRITDIGTTACSLLGADTSGLDGATLIRRTSS